MAVVDVVNKNPETIYFKLNVPIYHTSNGSRRNWMAALSVYNLCEPSQEMWSLTEVGVVGALESTNDDQVDFYKIKYGEIPPGYYSMSAPKKLKPGCAYKVDIYYHNTDSAIAVFICNENGCKVPMTEKLREHRLGEGMPKFDCGSCK